MIWIMLLLVSIHSVALAVFLFEMTINKFRTYTDKPIVKKKKNLKYLACFLFCLTSQLFYQ